MSRRTRSQSPSRAGPRASTMSISAAPWSEGLPGLGGLGGAVAGAQGKAHDGADPHRAALEGRGGAGHPEGVHAYRGEAVEAGLVAEPVHVLGPALGASGGCGRGGARGRNAAGGRPRPPPGGPPGSAAGSGPRRRPAAAVPGRAGDGVRDGRAPPGPGSSAAHPWVHGAPDRRRRKGVDGPIPGPFNLCRCQASGGRCHTDGGAGSLQAVPDRGGTMKRGAGVLGGWMLAGALAAQAVLAPPPWNGASPAP